jgi:hypothetical protein
LRLSAQSALRFAWSFALAGFSAVILSSICVLALAHVDDNYLVDPASGVWIGLSKLTESGIFYPPLFDGTHYGGTRYMPIPFLLPAGLDEVIGSLVVSEKLLIYLFAVLTLALVFAILRRHRCPTLASLALVAGVLMTWTGILAALGVRWDTPALLFQLAALALVERRRDTRSLVIAGILCSLGVASKLSAVWGAAAIVVWLLLYERRRTRVFVAGFAGSLAVLIGVFELASSGRFLTSLHALSFSAYSGNEGVGEVPFGFHTAVSFLKANLAHEARMAVLILPFVLVALGYRVARRRLTVYDIALPIAAVVLFFSYFDPGVSFNHLIDVTVLATVVVGTLWGDLEGGPGTVTRLTVLAAIAAFFAIWLNLQGWSLILELVALTAFLAGCFVWTHRTGSRDFTWLGAAATLVVIVGGAQFYSLGIVYPEVRVAARTLLGRGDNRFTIHPLAGYVGARDTILAEDPAVPVLLGQRAIVLDPFSFDRLVRTRPQWSQALAARVAAREFDKVVLSNPIERQGAHLGPVVNSAVGRYYRLAKGVTTPSGPYWIYVPK